MPEAVRINIMGMVAAALCSGSALVGLVSWMRTGAVTESAVLRHEARLSDGERRFAAIEKALEENRLSGALLQQDIRHILEAVNRLEKKTETK